MILLLRMHTIREPKFSSLSTINWQKTSDIKRLLRKEKSCSNTFQTNFTSLKRSNVTL